MPDDHIAASGYSGIPLINARAFGSSQLPSVEGDQQCPFQADFHIEDLEAGQVGLQSAVFPPLDSCAAVSAQKPLCQNHIGPG